MSCVVASRAVAPASAARSLVLAHAARATEVRSREYVGSGLAASYEFLRTYSVQCELVSLREIASERLDHILRNTDASIALDRRKGRAETLLRYTS